MPDSLKKEILGAECIRLKSKLEAFQKGNKDNSIVKTALSLREQIKSIPTKDNWPPKPTELASDYITVPPALDTFLHVLLGGSEDGSARINRLSWSIAQDVITAVSVSVMKTPRHVLLPWVIKTLTGNVEVIKLLNRLGHGYSYTALEEIDTALCIDKVARVDTDDVPLPTNVHPSIPTVLAFDNIDRLEESLSGGGTSHRVNGMIIQAKSLSCLPQRQISVVSKKDKKQSIQPSDKLLPVYSVGKIVDPPAITPSFTDIFNNAASISNRKKTSVVVDSFLRPF